MICSDETPGVNGTFTEEQIQSSNGILRPNIVVNISQFEEGTDAYSEFGAKLLPNTTYYFKVLILEQVLHF